MNVIQEIAVWAKKLPPWQSDALRRIFTSDKLSSSDEEEILAMLYIAHKVPVENTNLPNPIPFSDVVQETTGASRKVVLRELHSVVGVNALVPEQSIKFNLNGLTVIYGENGSGKSGYARVLKHACHAREKGDPILPDITQQKKNKPSATIELSVDGDELALQWKNGSPSFDVLGEIAVFDAHCARVFLDEANEAVYLPYGLDVFGKIAALCRLIKEKIVARLALIPQRLTFIDEFKQTTIAGRYAWSLTANSDLTKLESLSRLDEKQLGRLQELRTVVTSARANPPKQRAAQLRRVKSRFDQLVQKVTTVSISLSPFALQNIKNLKEAADFAAKTAEVASTLAFADDPIPSTGSDSWRALFDAAKKFSEEAAYPDEEFPVTRDGSVCVLCQQPLSDDAAQRFQRFKKFILDDAAQKKSIAQSAFQNALTALSGVDVDYLANDPTLLDEIRAHNETLATNVEQFFAWASERKLSIIQAITAATWDGIPEMHRSVIEELQVASISIETAAKEFDKADKPEELLKLQEELAELEDRERLGKHANAIKEFIEKKKLETALKACDKAVDTTAITRFGSELMEKAVTEQLIIGLRRELDCFDVRCVPLNVKKSGEKGKTKHQLTIQTGVRPSGVLSEGEQRVVAIACFLAELGTSNSCSPIIFDDPVCSLDHVFRERVAKRLADEGKKRQVVVFTHDIVMLLALERECGEQQVPVLVHTIRRSAAGPGECPPHTSRPWHASSTNERLGILKQMTAPFKKLQSQSSDKYQGSVAEFYGKLREAWERAIEEVLLGDVIQRYRPGVETQRLKKISFDASDYPIIEREMSKCSKWLTGHDSAAALGSPFPDPKGIDQDIDTLETFVKTLRDRSKQSEKTADALAKPPQPQVSDRRATKVIDTSSITTQI